MATKKEIAEVKQYFGENALAGTYIIDERTIEYGGPNSKPSDEDSADEGTQNG